MPGAPWDNPDLDDFEYRQGSLEGAGDWADSESERFPGRHQLDEPINFGPPPRASRMRPRRLPELAAPIAKQKRFRILEHLGGQTYVRSEAGWRLNDMPFTFEPMTGRLEAQLVTRLASEDPSLDDPADLVRRAWYGLALGHHDRVPDLAARALRSLIRPPNVRAGGEVLPSEWRQEALAAAAMLCSARRQLGESARALEDTEVLARAMYPPLMTSRAAAMCDVSRWEDAEDLALRARDIEASDEVLHVLERIARHTNSSRSPTGSRAGPTVSSDRAR